MEISSSLVSRFFSKWGDKEHCPYQVYRTSILRDVDDDSLRRMEGRYFETQCLGATAFGEEHDLPRLKNGEKSTAHKRIDAQVMQFELQRRNYMVDVNKFNTQVVLKLRLNDDFIFVGHLDLFPTAILDPDTNTFSMAFIDLKLAQDSQNTWGDFCWGNPHNITPTQMVGYHVLIRNMENPLNDLEGYPDSVLAMKDNVRGYYWVFGYNKGGFNPIEVTYTPDKVAEFRENLRRTMNLVNLYEQKGWEPTPGGLCDKCPVMDCQARTIIKKI